MNIAICDDNQIEREILETVVSRYFNSTSLQCEFIQYEKAMDLYLDIQEGIQYDLVFLDMYLPDEPLGIKVAQKFRELGYNGKILFYTSSADYALESYEVYAAGYILKPISFEKIKTSLDRYIDQYQTTSYVIKQKSKKIYIPINDIMYVESANTKCFVRCTDGKTYTIYKQLRQVETELADKRFLRCHQSYIVNMNYIREASNVFVLKDGTEILIKQKEKKIMHQRLYDYIGSESCVTICCNYEY